ncbi:MAG: thiamine pyrophosphate-binding protein [Sphingomonadaceae bacterium]
MALQSLGERIADLLVAEGIDRFFSLPEVTFGKLHDALDRRGVPLIAPHHETATGYVAEGYAQIRANIAVVGGAVGPGVMNLYPAIANSWAENLPILYLGSERTLMARNSPRRSQFQRPPNREVVGPITKFAAVLEDPFEVDDLFQEAFRQLRTGTPGPCYIGLPFDLLLEEHDFGPLAPPEHYRPATFLDTVSEADVEHIAALIAAAERPLIIGGSGLRIGGAKQAFSAFVEAAACPAILTHGGRGILPDTHPQLFDLGVGPGKQIAKDADLIFVVGSSIGEKLAFGGHPYSPAQAGFPNYFHEGQIWVHLDRDPAAIGRNRPVDHALVGEAARVLPRLAAALGKHEPAVGKDALATLQAERNDYKQSLRQGCTGGSPVHPGTLMVEVEKALPEDVILVRDGGATAIWQMNLIHHPISDHLKAFKNGNLGTGLPYAIGAALAAREDGRRVCLMTGDGAFGFYPMELETAVRYKLPIVTIVAYDAGWSLEVPYYQYICGRTFEVDHEFIRLDDMARTMGAHGEYCDRPEEIASAVERAFASGKPALVQVHIDRQANAYDMPHSEIWTRWHADKSVYTDPGAQ